MSQQVYANTTDKYSPQSVTNVLELSANVVAVAGANFAGLPAVVPSNGAFFDTINGVAITRDAAGNALYGPQLIGAQTIGVIPVSRVTAAPKPTFAANGDTYFQILQSGTYTFDFHAAFGGPSAANRMWEIGWLISDQLAPASGVDKQLFSPAVYWSNSATTGAFALSSTLTKYLHPGQLLKPVVLTTDGYTMSAAINDKAQTTRISWFKH